MDQERSANSNLSPYRIIKKIGAGGMGKNNEQQFYTVIMKG
jgi:hypothetical protein